MKHEIDIHRLLEHICKEDGGEENILQFAVWKVVLRFLGDRDGKRLSDEEIRDKAMDVLEKEIDKWVKDD